MTVRAVVGRRGGVAYAWIASPEDESRVLSGRWMGVVRKLAGRGALLSGEARERGEADAARSRDERTASLLAEAESDGAMAAVLGRTLNRFTRFEGEHPGISDLWQAARDRTAADPSATNASPEFKAIAERLYDARSFD